MKSVYNKYVSIANNTINITAKIFLIIIEEKKKNKASD